MTPGSFLSYYDGIIMMTDFDKVQTTFIEEARQVLGRYLQKRQFTKGELLWSEGQRKGMLVLLVEGKVKIYRLLPNGNSITLYVFGAGTVFGFMPFLDGEAYPAYAQAIENSSGLVMHRKTLLDVIEKDPAVALFLIKNLSQRLRQAFRQIELFSSRGALPKVASALVALAFEVGSETLPIIITLPISSNEYAQSLGLSPETFSRSISQLAEKKIIRRLKRNRFQILNFADLKEISTASIC